MSEMFKKGQLVAVNSPEEDDRQWHLRLYESQIAPDVHKTYNPEEENYDTWSLCRPAEEVWPNIFLGWERRAGEQAADAVAMESALVQRLRKQIAWLCQELNQINSGSDEFCHCPDPELRFTPKPMDCHPEGCASCWRDACRKAVKDANNG